MDKVNGETLSGDDPLDAILAVYLQAAESGCPPDRQSFIAAHADYRQGLEEFFASQDQFEQVARPFRIAAVSQAGENPDGLTGESGELVRYFGEYELLEEIARGGMGVVFKARQIRLNRVVALKMILSGQFASPDDVRRFQVEAANAAQLDHPHIVPIYEVGQHRGQHYYSMRLVDGGTLAGRIAAFKSDHQRAARLMVIIAQAVHYAHERGILHRDLKPGNILIDHAGQPHVTDFGLARFMSDERGLTLSGAIVGSPRYMSPEQARGEKSLTVASDVYSLGAILYEMLTGATPQGAGSVLETLRRLREQEPSRPGSLVRVDRDLETICLKCLRKEREERYGSANGLADDLSRWLAGEPIAARPVGPVDRLRRWCRREPVLASLSLTVIVTVVMALIVTTAMWSRAEHARSNSETLRFRATQSEAAAVEAKLKAEALLGNLDQAQHTLTERKLDLYRTLIRAARAEVQGRDLARANEYLRECPEELRGWDWHMIEQLANPLAVTIRGAEFLGFAGDGQAVMVARGGRIERADIATGNTLGTSPDNPGRQMIVSPRAGEYVACISGERKLTLRRGAESRILAQGIEQAAMSINGHYLAAIGNDITVWDLEHDGAVYASIALDPFIKADGLTINAAGTQMFVIADGTLLGFNIPSGTPIPLRRSLERDYGGPLAFSPDGRWLAREVRNSIVLLNLETEQEKDLPIERVAPFLGGKVASRCSNSALVFSRDGMRLACNRRLQSTSGRFTENQFAVWNVERGEEELVIPTDKNQMRGLEFSPNGRWLAATQAADTVVFAVAPERHVLQVTDFPGGRIHAVSVSGDGRYVASGIGEGTAQWRVTDLASGRTVFKTGPDDIGSVHSLALTHDGGLLIGPAADGVRIFEVATGKSELLETKPGATMVAISPDDKLLAIASGGIQIWNLKSRSFMFRLPGSGGYYGLRFSPDGRRLAVVGTGTVTVWDVEARAGVFQVLVRNPYRLAFSPDSNRIVVGTGQNEGGMVLIFDVATGKEQLRWIEEGKRTAAYILDVAFSPGGQIVACAATDSVVLRDARTGQEVMRLYSPTSASRVGIFDRPYALAFTPDGRRMISGWGNPARLLIWDTSIGAERLSMRWPAAATQAASTAISPAALPTQNQSPRLEDPH